MPTTPFVLRTASLGVFGALMMSACAPSDETAADNATDNAAGDSALLADAPESTSTDIDISNIPEGIVAAAEAKVPGMVIAEVEKKEREGMVFFDVEGTRPDGSEVELDMLQEDEGNFRVVEVQRDIAWDDVPANARSAAEAVDGMFAPERVIESVQNDGTVIYELFAPGKTDAPSAEISVKDGEAKMLTERWEY
ncbi:MAG: hypothetical protein ABJ205_11050 [Erythrobacter sp.]|uniref:hypothetical protein n=1 Tax=Erythrobacter sp. TaxID=1042 RepID=UPI0032673CDD